MRPLRCLLVLTALQYFSCSSKNTQPQQHSFYAWNGLDFLVITNYENKAMSIKQFYNIANHYLDSVNNFFPLHSVTFMGEAPGEHLPSANDEDFINQRKYHFLVSFDFEEKGIKHASTRRLKSVDIWANGLDHIFYYDTLSKTFIDRLLSSDSLFDNSKLPVYRLKGKWKI